MREQLIASHQALLATRQLNDDSPPRSSSTGLGKLDHSFDLRGHNRGVIWTPAAQVDIDLAGLGWRMRLTTPRAAAAPPASLALVAPPRNVST